MCPKVYIIAFSKMRGFTVQKMSALLLKALRGAVHPCLTKSAGNDDVNLQGSKLRGLCTICQCSAASLLEVVFTLLKKTATPTPLLI